jgi:hypothetical protein
MKTGMLTKLERSLCNSGATALAFVTILLFRVAIGMALAYGAIQLALHYLQWSLIAVPVIEVRRAR